MQMGKLIDTATGYKIIDRMQGVGFGVFGIFLVGYFLTHLSKYTWGVIITCLVVGAACIYYGYDRLLAAKKNEIRFYEKGMEIQKGNEQFTIVVAEIKNLKMTEKTGGDYMLTFVFTMKNGETYSIDSDDYKEFPEKMKAYGKKFGLDWSFR